MVQNDDATLKEVRLACSSDGWDGSQGQRPVQTARQGGGGGFPHSVAELVVDQVGEDGGRCGEEDGGSRQSWRQDPGVTAVERCRRISRQIPEKDKEHRNTVGSIHSFSPVVVLVYANSPLQPKCKDVAQFSPNCIFTG